jgi:hypothetical protein
VLSAEIQLNEGGVKALNIALWYRWRLTFGGGVVHTSGLNDLVVNGEADSMLFERGVLRIWRWQHNGGPFCKLSNEHYQELFNVTV